MSEDGNGKACAGAHGEALGGATQGQGPATPWPALGAAGAMPGAGPSLGPARGPAQPPWGPQAGTGTPPFGGQGQATGGMGPEGAARGMGQAPWPQGQAQWQHPAAQPWPGQAPGDGWPHPGTLAMAQGQASMGQWPSATATLPWATGVHGYPLQGQGPAAYGPGVHGPGYGSHLAAGGGQGAGPQGGAGMSQLMQEIAGGGNGLSSLSQMLNLDDKELWKGALIGAAVVLLLTNESVQNALFKTGVRARDAVKSGVEKVKASAASASAEVAKKKPGGRDE